MKLWKENHKECQEACMKKKAGKLAYMCKDTTNNMMEVCKKNPNMSFRELLKMTCKERGIELDCNDHHSEHSDSCPESEREDKKCHMKGMDMMGHGMKGKCDRKMDNMRKDSEKNTQSIETPKG